MQTRNLDLTRPPDKGGGRVGEIPACAEYAPKLSRLNGKVWFPRWSEGVGDQHRGSP